MDLKPSVGVRYDAICIERLSQNRRTDRIEWVERDFFGFREKLVDIFLIIQGENRLQVI